MSQYGFTPPVQKVQGSCPAWFQDCGDGNCCPPSSSCATSGDKTICTNDMASYAAPPPAPAGASTQASSSTTTTTTTVSSSSGTSTGAGTSTSSPAPSPSESAQQKSSMQPGQIAGAAVGATVGAIILALLIISACMWYHKRRPAPELGPGKFNPAADSVQDPGPRGGGLAADPDVPVTARLLPMGDPAAWLEQYSESSPRELDGRGPRPAGPPARARASASELPHPADLRSELSSGLGSYGSDPFAVVPPARRGGGNWEDGPSELDVGSRGGRLPAEVPGSSAAHGYISELPD